MDDALAVWEVLPITSRTVKLARRRYDGADFEDCLQAACAEEAGYEQILTLDKKFRQHSRTKLAVTLLRANPHLPGKGEFQKIP